MNYSKYSFISAIGMSSIYCCFYDVSRAVWAKPPKVGTGSGCSPGFRRDMGDVFCLIGDFNRYWPAPRLRKMGDFGLSMALEAAVPVR